MDRQQIITRERRWAPLVLPITLASIVATVAGIGLEGSAIAGAVNDAEQLVNIDGAKGAALAGGLLRALGFALLLAPLLLLFDAASARTDGRISRFRLLAILAPLFVAVSTVLTTIALGDVASEFVTGEPTTGDEGQERAEEMILDHSLSQVGGALGLAGFFGLVFSVIYTALWAMRTGLVTRFWGTLGMAFGALTMIEALAQLNSPLGFVGSLIFFLHVALVANGRWFGPQPPAWAAGKAIPWLAPGEQPPPDADAGEQPARPEDFEGAATERPARRDNRRKRKRKQRGN